MEKTQSRVARSSARFFCGPKPGQSGVWHTRAPIARAIATVSSVLPLSTTTTSSANATDSRQARRRADSLWVMTMTDRLVAKGTLAASRR